MGGSSIGTGHATVVTPDFLWALTLLVATRRRDDRFRFRPPVETGSAEKEAGAPDTFYIAEEHFPHA